MSKRIFIINGIPTSGKDTFVELVSNIIPTMNVSSVDKIKEITKEIEEEAGLNELPKTEEKRKFLSDLKALTASYCDMPFQSMKQKVKMFNHSENLCLFLHIREPEEIKRAVKEFNAKTILVVRNSVKQITSNTSDANVYNYNYDYTITNNGTIEALNQIAEYFVKEHVLYKEETLNEK